MEIQDKLNKPFISLESSIFDISPLLELLESGLYIIADSLCIPTDGNGNFFWNASESYTPNHATFELFSTFLPDNYLGGMPVYMFPTQDTRSFNEERVHYYVNRIKNETNLPRAILYYFEDFLSFIIDGHHKASAAALLRSYVNCIVIMPVTSYLSSRSNPDRIENLCFGSIEIPLSKIPDAYIQNVPKYKYKAKYKNQSKIKPNVKESLVRKIWDIEFLNTANSYPEIMEFAEIASSIDDDDIPISKNDIDSFLNEINESNSLKLKFTLLKLKALNSEDLTDVALKCAMQKIDKTLSDFAVTILTTIRSNEKVEDFLIDFLIYSENNKDTLYQLVNSYWDNR